MRLICSIMLCGRSRDHRSPFCQKCYWSLPPGLREQLQFRRDPEKLEAILNEARKFLEKRASKSVQTLQIPHNMRDRRRK